MSPVHPSVIFRAYIGPRPVAYDDPEAFGKWDYASAIGSEFALPPYLGARNLTATLAAGTANGMAISGSALPAQAGVWVGPNGTGEGWEYIAYQNSHSGANSLRREVQSPHTGVHTSGAPVYFWFPLDQNNGALTISKEMSDNMASAVWTGKLAGVRAPSHVLKPEHLFMVTWTLDTDAPESSWGMLCIGVIEKITMRNDTQQLAEWDIEVASVARLYQNSTVPNMRIGPLDIALEASADASSTLGAAWKLTYPQRIQAEAGTIPEIDVVELQADMGPGNVVDGNENTLWVSDGWVGPRNQFENSAERNAWASLFMYPPRDGLFGTRYIEIINHDGLDMVRYYVYCKYSYGDGTTYRGQWFDVTDGDMFEDNGIPGGSDAFDVEDRLIIAENADKFNSLFPSAKPKYLIDAAGLSGRDADAVRRLWWEAGAIFMAWSGTAGGGSPGEGYLIHWGHTTYAEIEAAWDAQALSSIDLPDSNLYIALAPAKPGMVLRREMQTGDPVWAYTWDYIHHPGYEISNDQNDDRFANWLKVKLPEMTHVLALDIDATTTTIYLVDGQSVPNVEGISIHGQPGSIFIDDEIITFTGKNYDLGTLTGCVVTQKHKAGAKVYVRWRTTWYGQPGGGTYPFDVPFRDKVFDLATSAYPIQRLRWGRGYYANGTGRHPYPGSFVIRFSLYDDARTAYEDSHEADYFTEMVVDSDSWLANHGENIQVPNASIDMTTTYFNSANDGFRPRTVLMEFRKMFDGGGAEVTDRPRLNYLVAEVDRRYFNPATWLTIAAGGASNTLLISQLVNMAGWFPSMHATYGTAGDEAPLARSYGVTDRGTAWQVAVDMADYGASLIYARLNGRLRIGVNNYILSPSHEVVLTLTEADVVSVEVVNIRPSEVGQVRLKWENGYTKASGVVVWPDEARKGGSIIEIGPVLANSAEQALTIAFNHYQTKRFAYNVFYELANSTINIEVGDIHQLDYPFFYREARIRKILLVESVEIELSEGRLRTVVGSREIEREFV